MAKVKLIKEAPQPLPDWPKQIGLNIGDVVEARMFKYEGAKFLEYKGFKLPILQWEILEHDESENTCDKCGSAGTLITIGSNVYCEHCAEEFKCPSCGKYADHTFRQIRLDGQERRMCNECFSNIYKCFICDTYSLNKMDDYEDGHICDKCKPRARKCVECGSYTTSPTRLDGQILCTKCKNFKVKQCHQCGSRVKKSEEHILAGDNSLWCTDCWDVRLEIDPECAQLDHLRHLPSVEEHNPSSFGTDRYFGVEIETDRRSGIYTTPFTRVSDGSINGWEYLTTKLSGDKGMALLENFCDQLKANKNTASNKCGMHIHIDARDINPDKMRNLLYFYKYMEPYIYSLITRDRSTSTYCVPVAHPYEAIEACDTDEKMQNLYYSFGRHNRSERKNTLKSKSGTNRYRGLNISSYYFRGTVEFRYHHGCVDFKEMNSWIILNLNLFEWAIEQSFDIIKSSRVDSVEDAHRLACEILNARGINISKELVKRAERYSGIQLKEYK